MTMRKLPYFIITLVFSLGTVTSYADGLVFRIGNRGTYTGKNTSPRYSQSFPQQQIIGPFTSFSHAYGPVPAFGLRNYSQNRNTNLNYSGNYSNKFNSHLRDKVGKKNNSKMFRNKSGITIYRGSNSDNYKQGYRQGYLDATRATHRIFYFGGAD